MKNFIYWLAVVSGIAFSVMTFNAHAETVNAGYPGYAVENGRIPRVARIFVDKATPNEAVVAIDDKLFEAKRIGDAEYMGLDEAGNSYDVMAEGMD